MFSKIIQLSPSRVHRNKHITIFDLIDDPCLKGHSSSAGAEYLYERVVEEIALELRPVAFLNKKRRILTFKKPSSLKRLYLQNLLQVYRGAKKGFSPASGLTGLHSHSGVMKGVETVGVSDFLFSYGTGNACHTLSELLSDYLNGELPRSLYLGAVLSYDE